MPNTSIKNIQKQNLPRERLLNIGSNNLSDLELLAIILKSGGKEMDVMDLANYLLKKYSKIENIINLEINELTKNKYIGRSKAIELKAISEICKRLIFNKSTEILTINNPQDIYHLLQKDLYQQKQEYLYLISLDSRRKLIS